MRTIEKNEVFSYVFQKLGGDAWNALEDLLKTKNARKHRSQLVGVMEIEDEFGKSLDRLYERLQVRIRDNGALIVECFKPFRSFAEDHEKVEFDGDWNTIVAGEKAPHYIQLVDSDCPMYHSLLVVGVRRTPDDYMGGIAFLVQDSNANRPFAVLGLDLLRSMEVSRFLYVKNGLCFWTQEEQFPYSPASTTSGWPKDQAFSPRLNGFKKINDFQQNPGYYLHKIDPSKQYTFFS